MSNEAPRVWVNSSIVNWSFMDYVVISSYGVRQPIRMQVPPGVGVRLPKTTVEVEKAGQGMIEGRAE